jgi:hypothetical protein
VVREAHGQVVLAGPSLDLYEERERLQVRSVVGLVPPEIGAAYRAALAEATA